MLLRVAGEAARLMFLAERGKVRCTHKSSPSHMAGHMILRPGVVLHAAGVTREPKPAALVCTGAVCDSCFSVPTRCCGTCTCCSWRCAASGQNAKEASSVAQVGVPTFLLPFVMKASSLLTLSLLTLSLLALLLLTVSLLTLSLLTLSLLPLSLPALLPAAPCFHQEPGATHRRRPLQSQQTVAGSTGRCAGGARLGRSRTRAQGFLGDCGAWSRRGRPAGAPGGPAHAPGGHRRTAAAPANWLWGQRSTQQRYQQQQHPQPSVAGCFRGPCTFA